MDKSKDKENSNSLLTKNKLVQFFVKSSLGTITLEKSDNMTVRDVKNQIFKKLGIPEDLYYLSYSCHNLDVNRCLSDYNIGKEATLELIIRASTRRHIPKTTLLNKDLSEKK